MLMRSPEQLNSPRRGGPVDYPDHYRLAVCEHCRAALDVTKGGAWCHRCQQSVGLVWMIALPHHTEVWG